MLIFYSLITVEENKITFEILILFWKVNDYQKKFPWSKPWNFNK